MPRVWDCCGVTLALVRECGAMVQSQLGHAGQLVPIHRSRVSETMCEKTYAIRVEWDRDHESHVCHEMRTETDPETVDMRREELANLEDGIWGAYGVVLVSVCSCCDAETVDYGHALWGCVVDWSCDLIGTYPRPEGIQDAHLREVARDILSEVGA